MSTKYEQSWKQIREMLKRQATAERRRKMVGKTLGILLVSAIAGMGIFSLVGCASIPLAEKNPLEELGQPATVTGLVQVGQMGEDCTSQNKAMKRVLRDVMFAQGVPAPQKIEVRPLAGSSLCGFSQGTANEMGTLELGARNTAKAEVKLYWSDIKYSDLQKASNVLASMRPIRSSSKTANLPTK